jgi:hypothetical protein
LDEDQYAAAHKILGQKAHYTTPDPYQTYYPAKLDRTEAMNRTDSEYVPEHYYAYDPTFCVSALAYPTEIRRYSLASGGEMALGSSLDDYSCNRF